MKNKIEGFTKRATFVLGSPYAVIFAVWLILTWIVSGPFFKFSSVWQLVINTTTTIITFIMVFIIQETTNRETKALHVKLDALIRATPGASDELMGLEEESDEHIESEKNLVRS